MTAPAQFHQILYVSQIACAGGADAFASICHVTRRRNADMAVTGALLFDGRRFCQLLQGPARAVKSLTTQIACDRRHAQMSVLCDQPLAANAAESAWAFGHCHTINFGFFDAADGLGSEPVIVAFRQLMAGAALWP